MDFIKKNGGIIAFAIALIAGVLGIALGAAGVAAQKELGPVVVKVTDLTGNSSKADTAVAMGALAIIIGLASLGLAGYVGYMHFGQKAEVKGLFVIIAVVLLLVAIIFGAVAIASANQALGK